jgi:hypothetical protein
MWTLRGVACVEDEAMHVGGGERGFACEDEVVHVSGSEPPSPPPRAAPRMWEDGDVTMYVGRRGHACGRRGFVCGRTWLCMWQVSFKIVNFKRVEA